MNFFSKKAIFLLIAVMGGVFLSTISYISRRMFDVDNNSFTIPEIRADIADGSSSDDCDMEGGSGGGC